MTALTSKSLRAYALYFLLFSTIFKVLAIAGAQLGLPLHALEGMALCGAAFVMLFRFFRGQGRNTLPAERNYLASAMAFGFAVVDVACFAMFGDLQPGAAPADFPADYLGFAYALYFLLNFLMAALLLRATLSTWVSKPQADRYFAGKK